MNKFIITSHCVSTVRGKYLNIFLSDMATLTVHQEKRNDSCFSTNFTTFGEKGNGTFYESYFSLCLAVSIHFLQFVTIETSEGFPFPSNSYLFSLNLINQMGCKWDQCNMESSTLSRNANTTAKFLLWRISFLFVLLGLTQPSPAGTATTLLAHLIFQ